VAAEPLSRLGADARHPLRLQPGTSYSAYGEVGQPTLGPSSANGTKKTFVTNTYEDGTRRLTRSNVIDQTHAYMLQDLNHAYAHCPSRSACQDTPGTWKYTDETDSAEHSTSTDMALDRAG
jgi:hypothetical protein